MRLSISIDQKWSRCLVSERQMREEQLEKFFIKIKLDVVKGNVESYRKKFNPKVRSLKILQGKYDEISQQTKQKWKVIFGLSTKSPTEDDDKLEEAKAQKKVGEVVEIQPQGHQAGEKFFKTSEDVEMKEAEKEF